MIIKKLAIAYIIILLISSSMLAISSVAEDDTPPNWNKNWTYKQEIILPISTSSENAKFQPIDIRMSFDHSCWAKDEKQHSIRVVCWDGSKWHELESQIYDLEFASSCRLSKCGLVFLVPEIANGKERYFVYYDKSEKSPPNYEDHVKVEDAYFYFEPISGISIEGDYYEITEDGNIVYAIGQKGHIMDRKLSQVIIKAKAGSKEFDLLNSEIVASFCFSYHLGFKDEDEVSSDQKLVSKKIIIDGNLMTEIGIISQSFDESIRTTNFYKYYYCPTQHKRICAQVKHQTLKGAKVKGIINVDGRYGALVSYKSKSARISRMRFGDILPYLHVNGENDRVMEYNINTNPEGKNREWIISYEDDCDLGQEPWISYDYGNSGKAHAVLFYPSEKIVKEGSNERDGIQIKVNEKEYLDVIGAEVDYAAINFGRNSYERGGSHDIDIPNDLIVEYNAEFFSSENDSFHAVEEEDKFFRTLVKYRHDTEDGSFDGDENIHTLTVFPTLTGLFTARKKAYNLTKGLFSIVLIELYKDGNLISSKYANKPLIGIPKAKFPKLAPGKYTVKVYRLGRKNSKNFIGFKTVDVQGDSYIKVSCTWERNIKISISDQNGYNLEDVEFILYKDEDIVNRNVTTSEKNLIFNFPFTFFDQYELKGFYKNFLIYEKDIAKKGKNIDIVLPLYDLTIKAEDRLGFAPEVNVRPFITSKNMYRYSEIQAKALGSGKYIFEKLPEGPYELQISYGSFSDKLNVEIPNNDDSVCITFSAKYDLGVRLFDSYGNSIDDKEQKIKVVRQGEVIYDSINPGESISLPPGTYTIKAYSENELIASKTVLLTNNKEISIVTSLKSVLPTLFIGILIVLIVELFVLFLIKKISLNTFLKALSMALIIMSLFQPWWVLDASDEEGTAEKHTELIIDTRTMMENVVYEGKEYRDIATIPEVFTDFLGLLVIVVCSGFILLGISFIPNIVLKRRFSLSLIISSALFLILVAAAFCFGMSKITEISLGTLQGEGLLNVTLPSGETAYMSATWGMGNGFYLCIISALIVFIGGIIDYIRKKDFLKKVLSKK